MTTNAFNSSIHVTAGQLRRLGFLLSEMIDNAAFVRRDAVGLDNREDLDDGTASLRLRVLLPFQKPARRLLA